MLRWRSRQAAQTGPHAFRNAAPWLSGVAMPVLLITPFLLAASSPDSWSSTRDNFLGGFAVGTFLLAVIAFLAHIKLRASRQELQKARDLADHREYERNLA